MSANIWLEVDGARLADSDTVPTRTAHRIEDAAWNLTYNLTPMLREAGMPPWRDLLGASAPDAATVWRRTWETLRADPDRFRGMEPSNGWGTYDGAVKTLESMWRTCEGMPRNVKIGGWL